MSTITNYDYLLRNYYSSNRLARKSYNRVNMKSSELASADSAAIKKVAKTLKDMEYNSDNGVSIYNNVKAFVDTYNNLSENADKDPTMSKYWKRLKKVIKDNSSDLEDIGISIKSSGKLEVDKTKLVSCSPEKVGKVLSGDNTITKSVMIMPHVFSAPQKPLSTQRTHQWRKILLLLPFKIIHRLLQVC